MSKLTDQQYNARAVDDLRVVFHPAYLKEIGKLWQKELSYACAFFVVFV